MKRAIAVLPILLMMSACVHAQQSQHIGGTGGVGGTAGWEQKTAPALTIVARNLPDVVVGTAYSQNLTAVNGIGTLTWTVAFGSVPPGLTLNSVSGLVSGTPTTIGNYVFTILVTDSTSPTAQTATQQFSIAVTCPQLTITNAGTLPVGTVGTAYSYQFNSQGGLGAVTWAATGLSDLAVNSAGLLSGTPTIAQTQTFTITATDSCPVPQVVPQSATLTVNQSMQIVTPGTLPAGFQGVTYAVQFSAQGGTSPYTWALASGTLPTGLSLGGAGALTGTPTVIGTYSFVIRVTDNAAQTATAPFTLTISCSPLAISTAGLPNGRQGSPYSFQLTSTGGAGALSWGATGLPNGLSANSSGLISGTPTQTGSFTVTTTVTDSCSTPQSVSSDFPLSITQGLTIITAPSLPAGTVGSPYSTSIAVSGGVPPYQWTVPSGSFVSGAQDLLGWMAMKLPDRLGFHLTGGATPKYMRIDGGVLWETKSANGNPSDVRIYDDTYIYQVYTDNNDADQQAACQAAGYSSCFVDPFAYKQSVNPRPFTPRYFVPGSTVTILTPPVLTGGGQVNPYIKTTNCGADNQPIAYLGNVKVDTLNGLTMPPGISTWGGDVGAQPTLEVDYYYSGNSSGVYVNRERFYFVRDWGWVSWDHAKLVSGVYVVDQGSTNNIKTAGGAPTPNFPCGFPSLTSLGLSGVLPAGVAASTPQMNLASDTGKISGTPAVSGTHAFTIQVEDAAHTITQQQFTMVTTCPPISIATTSPIPLATQGQAYSLQLASVGGVAPVSWSKIQGTLPAGLTLSSAGVLSGTPTQTGSFTFVAQVTDSCAPAQQSAQTSLQLSVQANSGPLAITTTSLLGGVEQQAYSQQLQASGGTTPYVWALASGSLPGGLSLSSAGVISGTPTAVGTFNFTVRVTDVLSITTTKALSITVNCTALGLTSTSPLPAGTASQAYSFQFTASGGRTPYSFALASGTLPTGVSLSGSGALTGTPSVAGTSSFAVRVTDSCVATAQTAQTSYSLTINPAPVPLAISTTSAPAGTEGTAYSLQLGATGGTTPYTWSLLSGSLPNGLSLSAAGLISGTPTAIGTFIFTAKVTDNVSATDSRQFTIVVTCPTLLITVPNQITSGSQGLPYSFQMTSTGGIAPVTWDFSSGSAPAGMSLSSAGLLSGTPSGSGTFNLNLRATDSCVATPQVTLKTVSLQITSAPQPTITTTSPLPAATEGSNYSVSLAATGGTPGYTWSLSAGTLPSGLTLSTAGVISGNPTSTGVSSFTVRVTDSLSQTATKILSITVSCTPLAITTTSPLPGANQNQAYSFQFTSSGGRGSVSWSGTGIPAGLSLSTSGALTGIPTGTGTSSLNITATDQCSPAPQAAGGSFSLTITAAPAPVTIVTASPLPAGTQGSAYSTQLAATGGVPGYTWALTVGSLPPGLSINGAGLISGTPTTIGTYNFTVQVTDTAAHSTTKAFSLTIACTSISITSALTLPTGTQNQAYSDQLTASGGIGARTWSLVGGAFPTGVSISGAGLISGTPSVSGSFSPQIRVTDSCSTPQTDTKTFSLTINPATVPLQITTATPLNSGTVNTAFSQTLSATGGTPPYGSWTVTVGSLPTGLSLGGATGVISGTPTVAGTSSFTVRVADSVAATATKAFSLTINPATAADNRYCSASSTWTGGTTDGPSSLPNRCMNTATANTPASGPVKTVCASGCDFTTVNAALTAASCGWIIQVKAKNGGSQASYAGFTLPAKSCTASNWIWIETDLTASLPAEGSRISPAWVNIPSLTGRPPYSQPGTAGIYLPKIICSVSNCIDRAVGANFYRLIGLEITSTAGAPAITALIRSTSTDHIIWDRVLVHGGNSSVGQSRDVIVRGWDWGSSTNQALIDSYVYDFHAIGQDNQDVLLGGCSAAAEGPFKVVDNFLEAAGENLFSGGCGVGATTATPTDFEIRRNHIFKPLFWQVQRGGSPNPGYFGTNFTVKNSFELKNANRVLMEGNIYENSWSGQADQTGYFIQLGAKNQGASTSGTASSNGSGTLTAITGTFSPNVVSANCAVPFHCKVVYNGVKTYQAQTFIDATHITVSPAPPTTASASFSAAVPGLNPNALVRNITSRYELLHSAANGYAIFTVSSDNGDWGKGTDTVSIHDVVIDNVDPGQFAPSGGACCNWGNTFEFLNGATLAQGNLHDITVNHITSLPTMTVFNQGFGPSVGIGQQTAAGASIGNLKIFNSIFPAGFQRPAVGVCTTAPNNALNATSVLNCIGALNGTGPATYCFDHNALATTTTGTISRTGNNPPYPSSSPNCSFATTGNLLPASYAALLFTNLNGANGGNYQLQAGSPGHNAASDGTDLGVNWSLLQQNIAGVQ